MKSIEHRAATAPTPDTRKGQPVPYRSARLFPGEAACASRMGMLALELACRGGR